MADQAWPPAPMGQRDAALDELLKQRDRLRRRQAGEDFLFAVLIAFLLFILSITALRGALWAAAAIVVALIAVASFYSRRSRRLVEEIKAVIHEIEEKKGGLVEACLAYLVYAGWREAGILRVRQQIEELQRVD